MSLKELPTHRRYRLRSIGTTACYRVVEIVGINDDDTPMTIDWPHLYSSKKSAILEIERVAKVKFTEYQYKDIAYSMGW